MTIYAEETPDLVGFVHSLRALDFYVSNTERTVVISWEANDGGFNFSITLDKNRFDFYGYAELHDNKGKVTAVSHRIDDKVYCDIITFDRNNVTMRREVPVYKK